MLYGFNRRAMREYNVLSGLALYLFKAMFLKTFKITKNKNYEM